MSTFDPFAGLPHYLNTDRRTIHKRGSEMKTTATTVTATPATAAGPCPDCFVHYGPCRSLTPEGPGKPGRVLATMHTSRTGAADAADAVAGRALAKLDAIAAQRKAATAVETSAPAKHDGKRQHAKPGHRDPLQLAAIRTWGRKHPSGAWVDLSSRGRIPVDLDAAYAEAHPVV
jgi:hypothetical protein